MRRLFSSLFVAAVFHVYSLAAFGAPTLEKLADFSAALTDPAKPNTTTPIQIGGKLWFTTDKGGSDDRGTLATFDLTTNQISTVLSLGSNEYSPMGSFTQVGDLLYYTTTRGGTGDKGTISVWNTQTSTSSVLWNSPTSTPNSNPNVPGNELAYINNGSGAFLYFTTKNGGTGNAGSGTANGTVQKLNLATNTVTQVHAFADATGRQPFSGLTTVGTKVYFTTFVGGGSAGTGYPNGSGTLQVLDTTTDQVTVLKALPAGDGSYALGATTPVYDAQRNAIYVVSNGTAAQPGGLLKFDLDHNEWIGLWELQAADPITGLFNEGKFIYSDPLLHGDSLYFVTNSGGANGGGTINQFDLLTNEKTVLFNLGNDPISGIDWGKTTRAGLTVVNEGGIDYIYVMTNVGGGNNLGTVLRFEVVPEPGVISLVGLALGVGLVFVRRRK